MAGETRELKFRLALEYDEAGLSKFRSDVESVLAAARGAAGDLDSLASSLTSVGQEGESAASVLSSFDAGGLGDAAAEAEGLSGILSNVAAGADDASGALAGVETGGLGDAAAEAEDLSGSLADLAGDADDASSSLSSIDASGLDSAAGDVQALDSAVQSAASGSDALAGSLASVAHAASDAGQAGEGLGKIGESAGAADSATTGLLGRLGGLGTALAGPAAVAVGAVAGIGVAAGVAGAGALAIGDSFDGAYDAIAIATGATGERLEELKGQFKGVVSDVPTDFGSAAEVIGVLGQRMDFVGDIEALGTQILNLSRITGVDATAAADRAIDSFAKFNIAASDQGAALDLLFQASQQSGVGFDELQQTLVANSAVLQTAGLGYEKSALLIASLGQSGVDAAEVIPGLSRALSTAAKDGLDADEALARISESIKTAGSDAEAQQIAVEAFGKGGLKMAEALRSGALDATFLTTSLEDARGAINETATGTDDFGQSLALLKNKALVALEPLGELAFDTVNKVLDAFGPVAEQVLALLGPAAEKLADFLGPAIDSLMGGLGGLDFGEIQSALAGVGDTLATAFSDPAVGQFLDTVGSKLPEIGAFLTGTLIPLLIDVGGNFASGFATALPIILNLASALIDGLWPIVQSVFGYLSDNKETIADTWSLFMSPISALGVLADKLGGVQSALAGIVNVELPDISAWLGGWELPSLDLSGLFADVEPPDLSGLFADVAIPAFDLSGLVPDVDFSPLTDAASTAWADIQGGIDSAWASFDSTIQSAQDAIYDYLLGVWDQIPEDIKSDLVLIATHILEQFEEYRQTIEDKLTEAERIVLEKFEGARDTVDEKLDELVTIVSDAFVEVKDAILVPLQEAQAELLAIWSSVSTSASDAWGQVTTAVEGGVNDALAVLSNLRADIETRARAAWDGAVESARSALAPLVSVVTDAIDDALAFLSGVRSDIEVRAREAWEGVVTAADSALASLEAAVLDPIRQTLSRVAGLAGEAKTQALALGQAIVDGAKNAIIAGRDAVVASVLGITRAVLQAIKDFFNIKSPSGLMYDLFLSGVMGGAVLGIYDSEPLMVQAVRDVQAAARSAAADTPVLFLVDPAAEAAALAPFIAEIDRTTAALRAASDAADAFDDSRITGAVGRITAAFDAWFDSDAEGSLRRTLELLAGGGIPPVSEGDFLNRLGFDVSNFDELQARIAALADEPEKQHEMWKAVVDALTEDWKRFYDQQKASLDAQKEALAEGADSTVIDDALAALDERNRSITQGLDLQGDGLDRMLDAYQRIRGEQEELTRAVEEETRAREQAIKAAQDQIKLRQRAAEDAEEGAHDQAMDLLDDEVRARERAHEKEMKALDEHRKWVEADTLRRIGIEEEAHNQRLAAITAEVDAADAVNGAEDARITRANLLLDLLEKGRDLTQEQADFLRAQGIDPDQISKTNAGLADAKANIDKAKLSLDALARSLEVLTGFLDKLPDEPGRVSIAGGRLVHESGRDVRDSKGVPQTISEAERAALQKGIDEGTLTGSDKRIAEIALAGGVVQAKRLREVLGTLIGPQEAATKAAQEQLSAAEAILVVQQSQLEAAREKLAADEAALKVAQDEAKSKREGLAEQIRLENVAFENFKTAQEARLDGLAEERAARDQAFKEWKQAIADAKDLEEDRHDARMRAIDEEYALQLLRAGNSEAEVQRILTEQRERAAAIAAEAQRRFDEIMSRAAPAPPAPNPFAPPATPPPGIDPPVNPGESVTTFEDMFGDITAAGARAGDALATGLVDPALDRMDDLYARALDISGLFASRPDVAAFMGGGTAHVDNGIHFHGDVYIDRDLAEEIGLYDAARMGAP